MRPNEDYEDIEDNRGNGGSRTMSWMVLAVAVGGFAALAYYAYNSGGQTAEEGEMVIVEADGAPIKEAPADPEGEQFPNKDKTIYDVISQDGANNTEKLMPEPEKPVAAMNVEDSEDAEPAAIPAAPATSTYVAPAEVAKAEPVKQAAAPAAKAEEKSYAAPEMINEKTVAGAPTEAAKAEVKETPKPKAEKKAVSSGSGGSYKIQLGAFKSESEAQAAWKKISAKHGLTSSPSIIQADVNGTTYYRLRTGSYGSSAEAKSACASLGSQACMPVK